MSRQFEKDGNPLFCPQHEESLDPLHIPDSSANNSVHQETLQDFHSKYISPLSGPHSKSKKRTAQREFRRAQLQILRDRVAHAQAVKEQRYQLRLLEHEERLEKEKQHKWPAPGTVALCSCGMVTAMLNYPNTGHFEMTASVPAFQIIFAGVAQQIAGIFEWMNGVTFAYTAFSTYACYHMSIGLMILLGGDETQLDPQINFYDPAYPANPAVWTPTTEYMLGVYMTIIAVHSIMLWTCTFSMHLAICILLFNVFMTYFLQAIADMRGLEPVLHAGGYSGIISGGVMLYMGLSETVNAIYGRTIIPVFPWDQVRRFFCGKRKSSPHEKEELLESASSDTQV